jgi:hypothetical protein
VLSMPIHFYLENLLTIKCKSMNVVKGVLDNAIELKQDQGAVSPRSEAH